MVTAILILAVLALGYLAFRLWRALGIARLARLDLIDRLTEVSDARYELADELDRAETRIMSLELRAVAAETALAFKTLVGDGVTSLDAARIARAATR